MPELPEVETVRRGLAPVLEGRRLARVQALRADLRFPFPDGFGQRLTGRRVERLSRRAKYLLAELDDGRHLIMHLGMSGRFRVLADGDKPPPGRHEHVIFTTDAGTEVRYDDARRFGFMDIAEPGALDSHPMLKDLGPEPLGDDFDAGLLVGRLGGRAAPIKTALLDQRVVAGLGNIYVCEALFRAGLSPKRRAGTVTGKRAQRLVGAIRQVLQEAILSGGSTLRDHRLPSGELGYFQHHFAVYGRQGEACPGCDCGGAVKRISQSGRSTFYCARRQR